MVPRQSRTRRHDLFEGATIAVVSDVDHEIFRSQLGHVRPSLAFTAGYSGVACMVDATAWSLGKAGGDIQENRGLYAERMSENVARSGRLRKFGSVTPKGAVAKYLSGAGCVAWRNRGVES